MPHAVTLYDNQALRELESARTPVTFAAADLLANGKIHQEYVKAFTNASYIVKEGYGFQDGLFAGYDEARKNYVDRSSWDYEFDEQGMAKVDETLQNPRCAINLLKAHVERYTPEMVERITGTTLDAFTAATGSFAPPRPVTVGEPAVEGTQIVHYVRQEQLAQMIEHDETQADIYGIFGREGLDLATRWTTPEHWWRAGGGSSPWSSCMETPCPVPARARRP